MEKGSGMENLEIARLLAETADLMEIGGEDGFQVHSSVCRPDLAARLSKVQVVSQPQDSFAAPIR